MFGFKSHRHRHHEGPDSREIARMSGPSSSVLSLPVSRHSGRRRSRGRRYRSRAHGVHAFSEASAGLPGIHQGGAEHEHDHQRHGDADACDDDARERESVAVVARGLSAGIDMR